MIHPARSNALALVLVSAAALCVVLPFVHFGIPSGHDFEVHVNSWIEVVDHWKQGNLYPHWDSSAHYEYGEARFIFYPPLSWIFGGLLGLTLPWKLVPAAFIWIVLTLAGWSMFVLARNYLSRADAILAAALYAVNPYNLVIVYWRSAFAELMAAIYIPLLLLLILRAEESGRRIIIPLSFLMAAGWLTNLPSAVMMNYSLAALAVTIAFSRKSWRVLRYAAVAVVLGAMLAAFFLFPAYHEQSWVNIGQVLAPGLWPLDNFLFTSTEDADHNRFNLLISIVAVAQFAILVIAIWQARRRERKLALLMIVWSTLCVLLMLKPTFVFWKYLPELRFVQFPWRWLLCLNVPFALAITFATRRWFIRVLVYTIALGVVIGVWHRVQVPWWDNGGDIQEMLDNQQDGIGNEGVDEYVPAKADPYDIDQKAPLLRYEGAGSAQIKIEKWIAERRVFTVNTTAAGSLVLRLFNYPSWKVDVNGGAAKTETTADTGQMVVPIAAGTNQIQIRFVEGWDRTLGIVCSLAALVALLILWTAHRRPHSTRNAGPENSPAKMKKRAMRLFPVFSCTPAKRRDG